MGMPQAMHCNKVHLMNYRKIDPAWLMHALVESLYPFAILSQDNSRYGTVRDRVIPLLLPDIEIRSLALPGRTCRS
jgi:hypothetical protein